MFQNSHPLLGNYSYCLEHIEFLSTMWQLSYTKTKLPQKGLTAQFARLYLVIICYQATLDMFVTERGTLYSLLLVRGFISRIFDVKLSFETRSQGEYFVFFFEKKTVKKCIFLLKRKKVFKKWKKKVNTADFWTNQISEGSGRKILGLGVPWISVR